MRIGTKTAQDSRGVPSRQSEMTKPGRRQWSQTSSLESGSGAGEFRDNGGHNDNRSEDPRLDACGRTAVS
jgi:hypothetical protein